MHVRLVMIKFFQESIMNPTDNDPFLLTGELAQYLGRSKSTIWRWVKRGLCPPPVRGPDGEFLGWPRSGIVRWKSELAKRTLEDWKF